MATGTTDSRKDATLLKRSVRHGAPPDTRQVAQRAHGKARSPERDQPGEWRRNTLDRTAVRDVRQSI